MADAGNVSQDADERKAREMAHNLVKLNCMTMMGEQLAEIIAEYVTRSTAEGKSRAEIESKTTQMTEFMLGKLFAVFGMKLIKVTVSVPPSDPTHDNAVLAAAHTAFNKMCSFSDTVAIYSNDPSIIKEWSKICRGGASSSGEYGFFRQNRLTMVTKEYVRDPVELARLMYLINTAEATYVSKNKTVCCDRYIHQRDFGTSCDVCGRTICWDCLTKGVDKCPGCSGRFVPGMIQAHRANYACAECGLVSPTTYKYCKRCTKTIYCSKECQVKHWPTHKTTCRPHGQ
jgi:hypothetical protein